MKHHTDSLSVAVFLGGRSVEHPVSCTSGTEAANALESLGHQVHRIGITRDGAWVQLADDSSQLVIANGELPEVRVEAGKPVYLSTDPAGPRLVDADDKSIGDIDVAFPALHGPWGEDGTVQGLFEMAALPYVGSDVLASSASMDKIFTKRVMAAEGIPQCDYVGISAHDDVDGPSLIERLGLPLFVKPARAGSSLGISKVTSAEQLEVAVKKAREIDPKLIVESGFLGIREVEVGVLQTLDGDIETTYPLEVLELGSEGWFDFDAKYLGSPEPFNLEPEYPSGVAEKLQDMARQVFTALDCRDIARVDCFLDESGQVYLNEINTMPGLTPVSGVPQAFSRAGLTYPQIVDRLVRRAAARGA